MKKSLFLFLFLLLMPLKTYAYNGSLVLECPESASVGDIIECKLKGNISDGKVNGVDLKIETSSNLQLKDVVIDSTWEGGSYDESDNGRLVFYSQNNKIDLFAIATLKVKITNANSDGKITVIGTGKNSNGSIMGFSDEKWNIQSVKNIDTKIDIKADNNLLSSLVVSNAVLKPSFDSNVFDYTASTTADKVEISATAKEGITITGDVGVLNLEKEINEFKINVTSESGKTNVYKITIVKATNVGSADATLTKLTLNDLNLKLEKDKFDYDVVVDSDIDFLNIEAILNDGKASFLPDYGPRKVKLSKGENVFYLKVVAEDGTVNVYTIKVTKKQNISPNDKFDNSDLVIENPKTGLDILKGMPLEKGKELDFYLILAIVLLLGSGLCFCFIKKNRREGNNE